MSEAINEQINLYELIEGIGDPLESWLREQLRFMDSWLNDKSKMYRAIRCLSGPTTTGITIEDIYRDPNIVLEEFPLNGLPTRQFMIQINNNINALRIRLSIPVGDRDARYIKRQLCNFKFTRAIANYIDEEQKENAKLVLSTFDPKNFDFNNVNEEELIHRLNWRRVSILKGIIKITKSDLNTFPFESAAENLVDYVNLYAETFVDEIGTLGPEFKKMFDELPDKVRQAAEDPSKLSIVWNFILFLIPSICTLGILPLLNKDFKEHILHPVEKLKLSSILECYENIKKHIGKVTIKLDPPRSRDIPGLVLEESYLAH